MTHTPGPWWYDEHTECIGSSAGWICSLRYYGERKSDVPFGGQTNDANLIASSPDLLEAAAGGGEVEDIYLYEFQRIAGPDATLSEAAQTRLHTLRQQRYAAIAKAKGKQ